MIKSASEERLAQFREDLYVLDQEYQNNYIAKKLGIHPTNLSSYRSAKKEPGNAFLEKFYETFGEEIKEMKKKRPYKAEEEALSADQESAMNEPAVVRNMASDERDNNVNALKDDHINSLKTNNEYLRQQMSEVIKTNQLQSQSIENLSQSYLSIATDSRSIATDNRKLVEALLEQIKKANTN